MAVYSENCIDAVFLSAFCIGFIQNHFLICYADALIAKK